MFESGLEKTIIGVAVALWFAHGWYLNDRLKNVHKKLDLLVSNFNGLREYLYETDPQFDDERAARVAFENGESVLAGANDALLRKKKKDAGNRTLNTRFDG